MTNRQRWQRLAGILREDAGAELVDSRVNVENDDEGRMIKGQLEQIISQAQTLHELMPEDAQLEGWVQSYLTLAREHLDVVSHYLLDESPDEQMDAHVDAYEEEQEVETNE